MTIQENKPPVSWLGISIAMVFGALFGWGLTMVFEHGFTKETAPPPIADLGTLELRKQYSTSEGAPGITYYRYYYLGENNTEGLLVVNGNRCSPHTKPDGLEHENDTAYHCTTKRKDTQ